MWDWFIQFLATLLSQISNFVGDWGVGIIVLTVIVRLILTPLTINSTKSSAKMQALQPKLQAIQERYADDPDRMGEELRKFYAENSFNPLGGCLPILLQMPIFFALFAVLRDNIPDGAHFLNVLSSLQQSVSQAIATQTPLQAGIYVVFDLLFGLLTFVPMYINTSSSSVDSEQKRSTIMMGALMAVMMMWIGWSVPVGILLYYVTSSLWGVIQQQFITKRVLDSTKAELALAQENAPVEVDVVRRERKPRPRKKS